jgi:prevent-host-death family protein
MKTTISATEARKNFYKLLRQAAKPGAKITITLEDEAPVVLMSQADWEGWMETLEVMSDPQLVADIEEAKKSKDYQDWEDVKKELGW